MTSDCGRWYALYVSMRYQSKYAAASDCATSMLAPTPVVFARTSAATIASAANAGPAVMPTFTWFGMRVKPSSSTTGASTPAHVS